MTNNLDLRNAYLFKLIDKTKKIFVETDQTLALTPMTLFEKPISRNFSNLSKLRY